MKKIFLLAILAATVASASAEGYQVNTLSAKQLGMGHTGVSQKLNSESVWFNPAAAAYQESKFTVAAGVTGIMPTATFKGADGVTYESDNEMSTPIYLYANCKLTDDLALGLSFNVPYGSSMNWGDNWYGMDQVQNISLKGYCIQPTVSYKLLDDKLSLGVGFMLSWGSFELTKSLVDATTSAYLESVVGTGVATAALSGDAALTYGFNIGAMYDITEKWSVGVSYRSKMKMSVDEGETELNFGNDFIRPAIEGTNSSYASLFGLMENYTFAAELPMPSTLSMGVTFLPTDKWKISAEIQRVGWSDYESLDFIYPGYVSSSEKDYDNTMIYRIGAQYSVSECLDVRAGFYYDESPVQTENFSPETPSMNKLAYTTGLSFMPCNDNRNFSIDVAYAYIAPAKYDRVSTMSALSGTYRAVAHAVAIGASWGF